MTCRGDIGIRRCSGSEHNTEALVSDPKGSVYMVCISSIELHDFKAHVCTIERLRASP